MHSIGHYGCAVSQDTADNFNKGKAKIQKKGRFDILCGGGIVVVIMHKSKFPTNKYKVFLFLEIHLSI